MPIEYHNVPVNHVIYGIGIDEDLSITTLRRIVACVNFCRELATKSLEGRVATNVGGKLESREV